MEIEIRNEERAETFCALFQHMKWMTDIVTAHFSESEMYIQCLDSAHVCILEIRVPAEWFDAYRLSAPVVLSAQTAIFVKILQSRDKQQTLRLQFDAARDDQLVLRFEAGGGAGGNNVFDKVFELPLMNNDLDLLDLPPQTYQAEMAFPSSRFASIVHQLQIFGDTMDIECSEEAIVLYSTSAESGRMSVQVKMDDLTAFAIDEGGEKLRLAFSLSYLHNMCAYHKIAREVQLHLVTGAPMKIVYDAGNGVALQFFLAPKIDDDNDA